MQSAGIYDIVSLAVGFIASVATGPLGSIDIPQASFLDGVAARPYGFEATYVSVDGQSTGLVTDKRPLPVDLDRIPANFINAVLAAEDKRFADHRGIDPAGLASAVIDTLRGEMRGGSSLTQQMIKNTAVGNAPTLERKASEAILALRAHKAVGAGGVLQLYLENAWFGRSTHGAADAAQVWFGKPWSDLDLAESVMLASLLKGPTTFDPVRRPEASKSRRDAITDAMLVNGWITAEEAGAAKAKVLVFSEESKGQTADWVASAISAEMSIRLDGERLKGGNDRLEVVTTIDARWQAMAQDALQSEIKRRGLRDDGSPIVQGAVVILDPRSGEILASIGGFDYAQSAYDRTQAMRQPGSSVKPFLYLAALDSGFRGTDWISNERRAYNSNGVVWRPGNYDGSSSSNMRMFEAVEQSSNLAAAWMADQIGISQMERMANLSGAYAPGDFRLFLPSALGASETTLTRLTSGYGTLINDGILVSPHVIKSVNGFDATDSELMDGRKFIQSDLGRNLPIASRGAISDITAMMRGVVVRGTASQALSKSPVTIIGKTGTSQNHRDAWFVGVTPDIAIGVWIGRDDSRGMGKAVTGGLSAAPVVADILKKALADDLIDADGYRSAGLGTSMVWPPELYDRGGADRNPVYDTAPAATEYFSQRPVDEYNVEPDGTFVFGSDAQPKRARFPAPVASSTPPAPRPVNDGGASYFGTGNQPGSVMGNRNDPYFN